ncbi:MAG: hypothetical protein IJN61_03085, partial [Clostridia bacterium]|nr:hypothetical protein [Clostridia bacterium]
FATQTHTTTLSTSPAIFDLKFKKIPHFCEVSIGLILNNAKDSIAIIDYAAFLVILFGFRFLR